MGGGVERACTTGLVVQDQGAIDFSYEPDQTCQWLLTCSVGTPLVAFSNFNTEAGYDLALVYDGTVTAAELLGAGAVSGLPSEPGSDWYDSDDFVNWSLANGWLAELSGDSMSGVVEGSQSAASMIFVSDSDTELSGFTASFTCSVPVCVDTDFGTTGRWSHTCVIVNGDTSKCVGYDNQNFVARHQTWFLTVLSAFVLFVHTV